MTKWTDARTSALPRFGRDERAVSDVIGSVMLIGITVVAAAGFGVLLVAYEGPEPATNTRLGVTIAASGTSWGTGSEELRVTHLGGKDLRAEDTTIRYTLNGVTTRVTGADLGSGFADGRLTIGERWSRTVLAYLNDAADVDVMVGGATGSLLTSSRVLAGALSATACLGDLAAPSAAQWAQSPADVTSLTTGTVDVTVRLADGCAGVDSSGSPSLHWCVDVACTIPTSFANAGPMTNVGTDMWAGTVPYAGNWFNDSVAGKSLQYYVSPVTDLNNNTGQTATNVDLVDLIASYTYVWQATATAGTVTDFDNAKLANGAEAALREAGTLGGPGSAGPTQRAGTSATGTATDPTNAAGNPDVRATLDAAGEYVEVSGFTAPSNTDAITAVTIGFEGRKSQNGGTSPTARLDYRIGSGAYNEGSTFTVDATSDTAYTRTLTGSFSLAHIANMTVRLYDVATTNRDIWADEVFVTLTYTTLPGTTYSMDIGLEWQGVSGATVQALELRYRVATPGDTFQVQVYNGAAWRTCSGTLTATSLATFGCPLVVPDEQLGGAPKIRFVDVTPGGTSEGVLYLDYARMATA